MSFLHPVLQILRLWRRNPEKNLRPILHALLAGHQASERREISRTVYGLFRYRNLLDLVISSHSRRSRLNPMLGDLMRTAAFLLLFADRRPPAVVVNEAVRISPAGDKSYLNAVLRSLVKGLDAEKKRLKGILEDEADSLLPPFQRRELLELGLGKSDFQSLLQEPRFHFRVVPGPENLDRLTAILLERGLDYRELPGLNSILLKELSPVRDLLQAGRLGYLQNSASQAVAEIAAEFSGKRVLDACAAPGGKTLTLALLRPQARILANDLDPRRLRRLRTRLQSLEIGNVDLLAADLLSPPLGNNAAFDLIMLDAPCSALGTLRKNPDVPYKCTEKTAGQKAAVQFELAAALLRRFPGTPLLYSVCSFLRVESEEICAGLAREFGLQPRPLAQKLKALGFSVRESSHGCYLLPGKLENDLFYISLLAGK